MLKKRVEILLWDQISLRWGMTLFFQCICNLSEHPAPPPVSLMNAKEFSEHFLNILLAPSLSFFSLLASWPHYFFFFSSPICLSVSCHTSNLFLLHLFFFPVDILLSVLWWNWILEFAIIGFISASLKYCSGNFKDPQ